MKRKRRIRRLALSILCVLIGIASLGVFTGCADDSLSQNAEFKTVPNFTPVTETDTQQTSISAASTEEATDIETSLPNEHKTDSAQVSDSDTQPVEAPTVDTEPSAETESVSEVETVWISATGSKYHARSDCSNMKNPTQVTKDEAVEKGLTPCKKCFK